MSEEERKTSQGEETGEEGAEQGTADASPGDGISELEEALREAHARADDNWNQFLRARAELENVRRRAERDVQQARRHAIEKFASEMLAVRDSLEMGVLAADEPGADVDKLREGSELTLRMLTQAMEKFDIATIEPRGERFDPERHEAMAAQESAEHEPNTVIHVVQKGYTLGDRLLRPAMVIVSRAASEPPTGGQIDEQA